MTDTDPEYQVKEGDDKIISIKVQGNPKPDVVVSLDGIDFAVTSISLSVFIHIYNLKLMNIKRNQCGKKIKLKVNKGIIESKQSTFIIGCKLVRELKTIL